MVDYAGHATEAKKRVYGQAFTVYALAEYAHTSGDREAIFRAMSLVEKIEATAHDVVCGGYFETYERDWTPAVDQRLSDVDLDEKKSMNTHLHMLEAYANLLRHHEDVTVRYRLRELVEIFLKYIIDPSTQHFILFFDGGWRPRSAKISFGHDIEGSWLLCEAAEILGDADILGRARTAAVKMAQGVFEQGLDGDGGLMYEAGPAGAAVEIVDSDKHWWPQAEAVVGFLNAYQLSGRQHFLRAANLSWSFIEAHIVDSKYGEWFWLVSKEGVPDPKRDKVGPWKCPYHNSRTCFEVMQRVDSLDQKSETLFRGSH
jgi:mannobiose 2-epimerase